MQLSVTQLPQPSLIPTCWECCRILSRPSRQMAYSLVPLRRRRPRQEPSMASAQKRRVGGACAWNGAAGRRHPAGPRAMETHPPRARSRTGSTRRGRRGGPARPQRRAARAPADRRGRRPGAVRVGPAVHGGAEVEAMLAAVAQPLRLGGGLARADLARVAADAGGALDAVGALLGQRAVRLDGVGIGRDVGAGVAAEGDEEGGAREAKSQRTARRDDDVADRDDLQRVLRGAQGTARSSTSGIRTRRGQAGQRVRRPGSSRREGPVSGPMTDPSTRHGAPAQRPHDGPVYRAWAPVAAP